jgi:uncharacterized membrane protein YphA (DoxX/SURF4 family)
MTSQRIIMTLRILFGIHFLFNGLNYIFHFIDIPKPPAEMANVLMDALVTSGIFDIAKGVEVLTGLMLILNLYVPLALLVAFPVTIVITYMDVMLTGVPLYAGLGLVTFLWNAGLMLAYLKYYRSVLVMRATPGGGA